MSVPPYANFNLGDHVGDRPEHVQHNRRYLEFAIGASVAFLQQVHGTHIVELSSSSAQSAQADGSCTRVPGVACTVMVADCLPILLCAVQAKRALQVAAVHAGWRGLAGVGAGGLGIVESVYQHFKPLTRTSQADEAMEIIAWLGPCIGPQAFEVGDEVRAAFVAVQPAAAACFSAVPAGKWLADLPQLARLRLQGIGVKRIFGNDGSPFWCTVGNSLRFFSHRRDRVSGRQAACIWLD